nr:RNA-directed DNA polymerase, eukaryota, reverse transcriptase zinc-binding domain protein [Tanacetum cinerariifolium]
SLTPPFTDIPRRRGQEKGQRQGQWRGQGLVQRRALRYYGYTKVSINNEANVANVLEQVLDCRYYWRHILNGLLGMHYTQDLAFNSAYEETTNFPLPKHRIHEVRYKVTTDSPQAKENSIENTIIAEMLGFYIVDSFFCWRNMVMRSKEDDIQKVSTSIFVTNFPKNARANDLWNACKQYGYVVDAYIPVKRTKAGKRFGFVCFIKVFDVDRLVSNLCTVWMGNYHLHANVARFHRHFGSTDGKPSNRSGETRVKTPVGINNNGQRVEANSYSYVVKRNKFGKENYETNSVLVLDDTCLNKQTWVMIGFNSEDTKANFLSCVGAFSWFSQINQASTDFVLDERITWVDIEGIPLMMWSDNTFKKIAAKWGSIIYMKNVETGKGYWVRAKKVTGWVSDFDDQSEEDSDSEDEQSEGVIKEYFGNSDVESMVPDTVLEKEDIQNDNETLNSSDSLKFPPGFTPREDIEEGQIRDDMGKADSIVLGGENHESGRSNSRPGKDAVNGEDSAYVFVGSGEFKKVEIPRNEGSILTVMEDIIKEKSSFQKINSMVSDYFVLLRGKWVCSGINLLIISVYAPQEFSEKKMLWDYLDHVITNWNGEVIVMGDFNEVRNKNERYGSVFNAQGADVFNTFISKVNLKEVPLGGCGFTWCHKSATKMSKLDRFLMSEELHDVEVLSDNGNAMDSTLIKRMELIKNIQDLDKLDFMEAAQKAKIKWVIEGDENSKYYNGILNKKRHQLAIRGVLKDGIWIDNPVLVKNEFVTHFKCRFNKPSCVRPLLNMVFPHQITLLQQIDLEADVSYEEVKRAVWDCGIDKSPGPDGFTFGCNASFIALIPKISDAKMIDFEKAYDSVRWDYLDDVLRRFGFGDRWCGWIQDCLRSSRGSVLVNRSPTEEFEFYKGLKQGDPLSPFLFILIMESLHLTFKRVMDARMFNGIVLNSTMQLSHMFYADDAIFMGHWSNRNIDTLMYMLKCFHRASGLSINLNKSKLMGISVSDDKVEEAAIRLGCGVLNTPFNYLGSKVGVCMSRTQYWNEVVDKMVNRLSRWKMKTLSIGGAYAYSSTHGIFTKSFFNGIGLNSKKSIWDRWNNVLASKEKGDLGVSSLFALNRALLFKWVWRFFTQKQTLRARVISAIYGVDGGFESAKKYGQAYIWCSITKEMERSGSGMVFLSSDPNRPDPIDPNPTGLTRFTPLAAKFAQENFQISFRRLPQSGVETEQWLNFLERMEGVLLNSVDDRWCWNLTGSGDFNVASARKFIYDKRLPIVSTTTRWIKEVPIKVNILAWKVRLDCLPTVGIYLVEICNWWNVCVTELSLFDGSVSWIRNLRLPSKIKSLLEGVCYGLWWFIWAFRNKMVLGVAPPSKASIFDYRHDMVKDVLFDVCRRAGISAKKEAPVNFLTDPSDERSTLRPADVLIFGWVGGKHACVDLIGVYPLVGLSSRGFTAGQTAWKVASCKVTKHEKACIENQHVFIPFAFDIFFVSLHLRQWSYSAEFNRLCTAML